MSWKSLRAPRRLVIAAIVAACATGGVGIALASDHQDTPDVELNPSMDMTDLYVFPSPVAGRVVLVMNSWGVLTPAETPTTYFDPNILYQFKIDNNHDGIEDKVIQVSFKGAGAKQTVEVRGPVAPPVVGAMENKISTAAPVLTGTTRTTLGSASGVQVYAGPRDDPFFIDLEQFFRIIPDRKPVTGALSQLPDTPTASAWRNPGIDFLTGFNVLSIVVELPASDLTGSSGPNFGVWATISR
ncbi:MAG TPA: DUF4331 family protein [Gemmatimonadales bacterium]|jgi:hypothetical protein|nr:DUF4331 family protein [Gemmatimonadales bacterium]